jgi:hypothetical protein
MKQTLTMGIVLVVLGVVMLAYQGFTYTTEEKVLDIGPIKATAEKEKTVPFPPILGATALAAGLVLVVLGSRKNA